MSLGVKHKRDWETYPPLQNLVDIGQHLVDPWVPILKGLTDILIGANLLVYTILHVHVAAVV
jgi:hypothetical protein